MTMLQHQKALDALEAYEALEPTVTPQHLAKVADALYEALKAFLPRFCIVEALPEKAVPMRLVKKDLRSVKEAQQWIADTDPAARRVFHIKAQA